VKVFNRYLDALDNSKHFFLASDIQKFKEFEKKFDEAIRVGNLQIAYDMYHLNLERRQQRYQFAQSLLSEPFDFTEKGDRFYYDREEANWASSTNELDELWRQRVKYDALNLKLGDKTWEEIQDLLGKRYKRAEKRLTQTKSEDVFQAVMNSFARSIEAHTSYLSPQRTERFQMDMNLEFEGIGAVLRIEEDHTTIMSVVAGGPADKSGEIKPEDRIIGVAQSDEKVFTDVVGWRLDEVVELIKGPKGSTVKLQVQKGGSSTKNVVEVAIVRDKIKLEDRQAKSEVIEPTEGINAGKRIGVIEIPSFYHNLHVDVKKLLDELKEQEIEGLIVDLMVDRFSASASEIFAAALQDFNRAVIIGEQTFGKGTVQQHRSLGRVYDFFDNKLGAVQYTMAKFYRINGGSTQHKGVVPDILYPSAIDPDEWGESREDNALPWDKIRKANYRSLPASESSIDVLAAKHNARTLKDPEFQYIFEDIEHYNKNKDKKFISLVEAERVAEKKENEAKRLARVNERLERLGLAKIESLDADIPDEIGEIDPFLNEAANITFDMIESGIYALNSSSS